MTPQIYAGLPKEHQYKYRMKVHFNYDNNEFLRIVNIICKELKLTPLELISKVSTADIVYARQITIYIIRRHLTIKVVDLAKNFKMHYTTICYNYQKSCDLIKVDKQFRDRVERIKLLI